MLLDLFDLLLTPIYFFVIVLLAGYVKRNNEFDQPLYKFYVRGLVVKLLGAIAVCLIYQYYYAGGDTTNYYQTARAISNILWKDPEIFIEMLFGNNSPETYCYFDINTGWPENKWSDDKAIFVSRLMVPFCLLSFNSFVVTAIILAWACYTGVWRLFLLFNEHFPEITRELTISILFVPSVVFWGSGLLKDTITLSAVGWYIYHFSSFLIKKKYNLVSASSIIISSYLLIAIKPYIFFALIPGSMIWLANDKLLNVKNKFIKMIMAPFLIALSVSLGFIILSQLGNFLGDYSLDRVMNKAIESNYDQKQGYYGGNSFDIGEIDPSPLGMLKKAPLAISATLFRPYIWDARNPVMLISAIENTYIMLLTIFLLFRLKLFGFFKLVGKNPLLLFSILFSLFFAFSVGIATSNFGSLVRLKIPCIPFYLSSLFALKYYYDQSIKKVPKKNSKQFKNT